MFRYLKNWLNTLRFTTENRRSAKKPPLLQAIPPQQWLLNQSVKTHQTQPTPINVLSLLQEQFTPETLTAFLPPTGTWAWLESLQTLEWLSLFLQHEAFPTTPNLTAQNPLRWLDVGSKNFAYAPALAVFLQRWAGQANNWHLKGLELDAGRLDAKGISRTAYAHGVIQPLPNTTYQGGDILEERQQYEGISLWLPFVFEDPLIAWGLPSKHFKPLAILEHCLSLLTLGGVLLIINLTPEEATQQQQLFEQLPEALKQQITWIKIEKTLPNSFINWHYERTAWLCIKHPPLPAPSA